ncbi:MAG: MotA/TolQ/ExbB proton channel family protein [Planctomycetota bacterium]
MTGNILRARAVTVALCFILIAVLSMALATAQEAEAGKKEKSAPRVSLFDTLKKGGTVGWVIVFLSVVAGALAVEHAITIRRTVLMPMPVIQRIRSLLKTRDFVELRDFCEENGSFVARVIGAAVAEPRASYEDVEEAMLEAGSEQAAKLYRKIEYLNLIGNVSTMLGLLGTVVGMVQAFDTIARTGGFAKPAELAGSISLALITTVEGLVVAIPSLIAYVYFRNKVEELSAEVAAVGDEIMKPIRLRALRDDSKEDEEAE